MYIQFSSLKYKRYTYPRSKWNFSWIVVQASYAALAEESQAFFKHSPHTNRISNSAILRNNYISLLSDFCACVHVKKKWRHKGSPSFSLGDLNRLVWLQTWKKNDGLEHCSEKILQHLRWMTTRIIQQEYWSLLSLYSLMERGDIINKNFSSHPGFTLTVVLDRQESYIKSMHETSWWCAIPDHHWSFVCTSGTNKKGYCNPFLAHFSTRMLLFPFLPIHFRARPSKNSLFHLRQKYLLFCNLGVIQGVVLSMIMVSPDTLPNSPDTQLFFMLYLPFHFVSQPLLPSKPSMPKVLQFFSLGN